MYRILLCENDDKDKARVEQYLEKIFSEIGDNYTVSFFRSAESFLNNMKPYSYDIAIFDVEMDKITGIEAAKILRDQDKQVVIIFTTVHAENVFSSFYAEPLNYMIKPVSYSDFKRVISEAITKTDNQRSSLFTFSSSNVLYSIPVSRILYFESNKRIINIKLQNSQYSFYGKLNDLEKNLLLKDFIRCYQSYLVNPEYIGMITNNSIILKNSEELPISRGKTKIIKDKYISYITGIFSPETD